MRMKSTNTSEDVRESGVYVTDCCGQELIFDEGGTFWRCPRCHGLCFWELKEEIIPDSSVFEHVA